MVKRIVILTGSELRHTFFRKYIALLDGVEVIFSFGEGQEKSLKTFVEKKEARDGIMMQHVTAREQSERDFFSLFVENSPDHSGPIFIPKGEINNAAYVRQIISAKPDLLVAYGCSIIGEELLRAFPRRFLNVHLGLSPYYRGSGTNYWPLVNGEPEYVGATFMHIDPGIDTGEIIHQIRAQIFWGDTPHQIGNRVIADMAPVYGEIIRKYDELRVMPQLSEPSVARFYKQKDYDETSVKQLYSNFREGLVERYLAEQQEREKKVPLVSNPIISLDSLKRSI
ncbi:MAG: hypothetical protein HYW91_03440 [Candidatus Sungbacteria bacterium]|nr:hypothetical protein [Candidatus Sungbacteria bacterium]